MFWSLEETNRLRISRRLVGGFALARCVIEQDASQLEGEIVKDKDGVGHGKSGKRQ